MWKAAVFVAAVLVTVPANAEDGRVFDRSSGKSWSGSMRDRDDLDDRHKEPTIDLYSRDGQIIGTGKVDMDGRVISNETGRGIGVWRPSR